MEIKIKLTKKEVESICEHGRIKGCCFIITDVLEKVQEAVKKEYIKQRRKNE